MAFNLAKNGFWVFPLNLDGTPRTENGFKDASDDPYYVQERFEKYGDKAKIGVATGKSGLVVLDLDYKEDATGNVLVDGYDSLDKAWVEVPESFAYTSSGGQGRHIWYAAPEGKNLPRKIGYRKMAGVDRCSGDGYVVFAADTAPVKSELTVAPEWLQDETTTRTADRFEGDVKAWYETLEEGEPNALVRKAIEDAEALFADRGNDFTHSDVIEAQHRAIRLGAEGNPGVKVLIDRLEELTLNREGSHSRDPEEYLYEFQEGLLSGIAKHGAAIELRSHLPAYSISLVPQGVPDRLVTGEPGDKGIFRELLASLLENGADDLTATSVLWNSPRTSALARDWGLTFVNERVKAARLRPEPVRENPTLAKLDNVEIIGEEHTTSEFLTAREMETVLENDTFIDSYVAASASKGFVNLDVAVPAAWTCLSMAFGTRAYVPMSKTLEMNLWFSIAAPSGTGKSTEAEFMVKALNVLLHTDDGPRYSISANSSPEAVEADLLKRDGLPSMIYTDEASSFFTNLRVKDWMSALMDGFSNWYDGIVYGGNKLTRKELSGKKATTSLAMFLAATPDRLFNLIDAGMFASGFLARVNWVWGKPSENPDAKFEVKIGGEDTGRIPAEAFELAHDLASAAAQFDGSVAVTATNSAMRRLEKVFKAFDKRARKHPRYLAIEPSLTRLQQTLIKCSSLLALYRGSKEFDLTDVLIAIYYAERWFHDLIRVVEEIGESLYSREASEIERFIKSHPGGVRRAEILAEFGGKIVRSHRELSDRIEYLVDSARINRIELSNKEVGYVHNG